MIPQLRTFIAKNFRHNEKDLDFIIRNRKGHYFSKIIVFVLKDGEPKYIAKFFREEFEGSREHLHQEYKNVRYIKENILNWKLCYTLPEIVLLKELGGKLVFIESAFKGSPCIPDIIPGKIPTRKDISVLENSWAWLEGFYVSQMDKTVTVDTEFIKKYIDLPLKKYMSFNALTSEEEKKLIVFLEQWKDCVGDIIPLVCTNGDFNPQNLLFKGKKLIAVIDWEDSSQESLPFLDILHYFIVAGKENRLFNNRNVLNFRDNCMKEGWYLRFSKDNVKRIMSRMKIDIDYINLYTPLYFMITASREKELYRSNSKAFIQWTEMLSYFLNQNKIF